MCGGLIRGISAIVRQSRKTMSAKKMIGSQVRES